MSLVSRETVTGAKPGDGRQDLLLKTSPALEVRFGSRKGGEKLPDHGADRGIPFGGADARVPVDVVGK